MRGHIVAAVALGDECAHLHILYHRFLDAHAAVEHAAQLVVADIARCRHRPYIGELAGVKLPLKLLEHTEECDFGRIGDV